MVYPTPRVRTVFEPMEVKELSAILDDNTPPTVYDKEYYELVDAVIYSSAVVLYFPRSVEDTVVPDAIQSQVDSVGSVYNPDIFVNKLNEHTDESKFAVAVGSMDANPQDCEIFSVNPQYMDFSTTKFKSNQPLLDLLDCGCSEDVSIAFVSASHAENPTGVTPEILAKV